MRLNRAYLTRFSRLVVAAALVGSCTTPTDPVSVALITLQPGLDSVEIGATYSNWIVTLTDSNGVTLTGRRLSWESSIPAAATIDASTGVVTGVGTGQTTITVRAEGKQATAGIRVLQPVLSIVATPDSFDLPLTTTRTIAAQLVGPNGVALTNRLITWSSTNPSIAVVSATGVVTPISVGSTTINIIAATKTASVRVRVVSEPVTSVRILPQQTVHVIRLGQARQLTAECLNAAQQVLTGRIITWNSGNPIVATVSATGLVSGIALGSAAITATCDGTVNGTVTAQVTPIPVANVAISPPGLTLVDNTLGQLLVTARDSANNVLSLQGRTVVWTSDNQPIATVSGQGVVSAIAPGTANVTVSVDGVVSQQVSIVVTAIPVATVTVAPSALNLTVNTQGQLFATARDAQNAVLSLQGRTVIWTSDNQNVAIVSALGVVSAIAPGTTNVRVSVDGVVSQPVTITVTP